MTYDELRTSTNYRYSHTAAAKGYVSRRGNPKVYPYKGRYGTGYVAELPRWDTTLYYCKEYYLEVTK